MRTVKINWMKVAASFAPLTPYGVFFGPDGAVYGPDGAMLVPATDELRPEDAPRQRQSQPAVRRVAKLA
jgi:hypothetical protein